MKKIVLATGSAALLLLTACGGAAAPESSASGEATSSGIELVTAMPAGVGPVENVNWNLGDGEPLSLDPNLSWSGSQNFVGNLIEN